MLGFSTILEFFGLEGIQGIDIFFAAMAVIGTVLFTIYFLLVLIGGVADGIAEAIPFFDVSFEMDAEGVFHMLTIQGLLSFMMMFGIFGLAVSQGNYPAGLAIGAGTSFVLQAAALEQQSKALSAGLQLMATIIEFSVIAFDLGASFFGSAVDV